MTQSKILEFKKTSKNKIFKKNLFCITLLLILTYGKQENSNIV